MRHPEIENGLITPGYLHQREKLKSGSTSIDLLEIPKTSLTEARWSEKLDHDALLRHFEVNLE